MNGMQRVISGVTGAFVLLIVLFPLNAAHATGAAKSNAYLLQQAAAVFLIGALFNYLARDKKR